MAIVKMKRMTLLAMQCDKDKIFDALIKSNVVQLKRTEEIDRCQTVRSTDVVQSYGEKVRLAEDAMAYLSEFSDAFNAEFKRNSEVEKAQLPKSSMRCPKQEETFEQFLQFGKQQSVVEDQLQSLQNLRLQIAQLQADLTQNQTETNNFQLIADLPHPTTWYQSTEWAEVRLCQLPESYFSQLQDLAQTYDLVEVQKVCGTPQTAVVAVVAHKRQTEFFDSASALGLTRCSLSCNQLPQTVLQNLHDKRQELLEKIRQTKQQVATYCSQVSTWQTYVDWINLCIKKADADGDFQKTAQTFVLEGYYPAQDEQAVALAVESVGNCFVAAFDEIGEDEFAPTLTQNNKVVSKFECITNAYTPPSYHDIDPNPAMSVCYFVLFGFMVADIGYGLLLIAAGLFASFYIKQQTGMKTLLQVFGFCGISAIVVGALFGSFFCYTLYPGILPDASQYPMLTIILSVLLGLCHIMVGVGCSMATKYKNGQKLAAWLCDFPWIMVFIGLIVAIWNAALDMAAYQPYMALKLPQVVSNVGLYVCLGALAVGVIFAGLGTAGLKGKLSKSFGSVYGLINYFSDAMSYIRVFGLMLSSALIGQVVNMLAEMVSAGGGFAYVFGVLILIVMHLFNMVMGLLSVYIHNGRLQYVEFFGKFYEGDGQLFVPFGSDTKYILLKNEK